MKHLFPIALALLASPLVAEEKRALDAHEHGVGALNIAIEGNTIALELHVPGADIVGFEHAAKSAEDRQAIDNAVALLAKPLDLFVLPAAAECNITEASAKLANDAVREEHGHDDHNEHDDHAEEDGHDDHDHENHAKGTNHTEFHADYTLTCGHTDKVSEIVFAYFEQFENAHELEVQIVTTSGAQAFEVMRDTPTLDLKGMF